MAHQRGDVVAVPYEYSDLQGGKVRPAVILSSDAYNVVRPDVVVAGISTQIHKATPYDYVLADWSTANLRYPSLVRGRLLTLEQRLVRRVVGRLTAADLAGVEDALATFLVSDVAAVRQVLHHVDLTALSAQVVQAFAVKSIQAVQTMAEQSNDGTNLQQLHALLDV